MTVKSAFRNCFLAVIFLAFVILASVVNADEIKTYQIKFKINGEDAVTVIHIFPESPLQNPTLLKKIKGLNLDHVAFFRDEADGRAPSSADEPLDKFEQKVNRLGVAAVDLSLRKNYLARLRQVFQASFIESRPGPDARHYALITTITKLTAYSVMAITSVHQPIEVCAFLVALETGFSVFNIYRLNSIQLFLRMSRANVNAMVSDVIFIERKFLYTLLQNELISAVVLLGTGTFSTISGQLTPVINALVSIGEIILLNAASKAYQNDAGKMEKIILWSGAIGGALAPLDLIHASWMPVYHLTQTYDIQASTALLLGYYAYWWYQVKTKPEKVIQILSYFQNKIEVAFRSLQRPWLALKKLTCSIILQDHHSDE